MTQGFSAESRSIALCGSGGAGVMTAADMALEAAARAGFYALFGRSAGPQIRGGEAAAMVRIATHPIEGVDDETQILMAIDWGNVERFAAELPLSGNSIIVADPECGEVPAVMAESGARVVPIPFKALAKPIKDGRPNMVALGALAVMVGLPDDALKAAVEKALKGKRGDKFATAFDASMAAIAAGKEAAEALSGFTPLTAPDRSQAHRWLMTGNQATALGAIRGGIRFCAAYPITPASEILEWLSQALPKVEGTFVQAEDELASVTMCVGASAGGVPSLTATAGPGLSLMVEGLGLAVASETPLVVVDVQRGGPSTGIPTKSEQSDLDVALHGLHGDAPHLVLAPQSIADCLNTTQWAVVLAEALQTPALVLSDQSLGQSRALINPVADSGLRAQRRVPTADELAAGGYQRYAVTDDGISPHALPGMAGGQHIPDGLEHNPHGTPSSQAKDHFTQLDKRARKLDSYDYGDRWATLEGDGAIAVLCWGSVTAAAREAVARATAEGLKVRLIAPRLLMPARPQQMALALDGVSGAVVVEQSHSGQFLRYLRGVYDLPSVVEHFKRPGPLPLRPGEILAAVRRCNAAVKG